VSVRGGFGRAALVSRTARRWIRIAVRREHPAKQYAVSKQTKDTLPACPI